MLNKETLIPPTEDSGYFQSIGADTFKITDALHGIYAQKAISMYGYPGVIDKIHRGELTESYFIREYRAEHALRISEQISNRMNDEIMRNPQCASLRTKLENDMPHGYNHLRRVEKWVKLFFASCQEYRFDDNMLTYAISMYSAIRNHDYVEVFTKRKRGHESAAALFTFSTVGGLLAIANETITHRFEAGEIAQNEWEKIQCAATFMCLHHSKPEDMPTADEIMKDGGRLLHMQAVLRETEIMAKNMGTSNIENFFPPFSIVRTSIQKIRNNKIKEVHFTRDEVESIRRLVFVMATADKIDSNNPSDLSAARTFLWEPDRPLYISDDDGLSLKEEFDKRYLLGRNNKAPDDLSRLIFEISRPSPLGDNNPILTYLYQWSLFSKGQFISAVFPKVIVGDFQRFTDAYERQKLNLIRAIAQKSFSQRELQGRLISAYARNDKQSIEKQMYGVRIDPGIIEFYERMVLEERDEVLSVLSNKFAKPQNLHITTEDVRKIHDLIATAVEKQRIQTLHTPGPSIIVPPYEKDGYIRIDIDSWRI